MEIQSGHTNIDFSTSNQMRLTLENCILWLTIQERKSVNFSHWEMVTNPTKTST
uniref:Uncharacterized protein n=1 Tax=Rhizophora mucronata TaxID=61149 RepID=A0A2P2P9R2_RHIMU